MKVLVQVSIEWTIEWTDEKDNPISEATEWLNWIIDNGLTDTGCSFYRSSDVNRPGFITIKNEE
jgi:hypothetical protein